MCGIVGYIGNNRPVEILLNGLKKLEYRGYDSAGISLKSGSIVQTIKNAGKIANLESKIDSVDVIAANIGIGHTRWATHGEPNDINAHPHTVGRITLVHNGIIENASELKEKLISDGYMFKSSTDTEVVAALIDYYYEDSIITAISKTIKDIVGSYALAIICSDDDNIYAIRQGSPLIVGYGDCEFFVASDIMAIIDYTNKYVILDENELAIISEDGVKYFSNGNYYEKRYLVSNASSYDSDKCGYDHYMLKEIMEEPVLLEKLFSSYINNLDSLPDLTKYDEIHIVACGSAMYAGMIGKSLFENKAGIKVVCEIASEYRYKRVIYDNNTLVIVISQSGETADTIAALRKAKKNGIDTLGIVNVKTSTIALESDRTIFIEAGPEIAVATTKAYILQVAILSLLSYKLTKDRDLIDYDISKDMKLLPKLLKQVLDKKDEYLNIAKLICKERDILFIGRLIDYAISLEGSLKLKEISYIHSEAYQAGELKHGTISLVSDNSYVFSVISDEKIMDKTISNIQEVKSRGAKAIVISPFDVSKIGDYNILIPSTNEFFQSLLIVPSLQLIAYEVARLKNCNIDKPRNLAKSVTVE